MRRGSFGFRPAHFQELPSMTINAVLQRLVLSSPQPEPVASFYCRAFDYRLAQTEAEYRCEGQHRSLWIRRGPPNQLVESHFLFPDPNSFERYVSNLSARGVPHAYCVRPAVLKIRDPDGRSVIFSTTPEANSSTADFADDTARPARLQHYAVRTPDPKQLV